MENAPKYSLKDLIIYFLKLDTWGFGGPVALVGYMHRDFVDDKKWINDEDYKEGLALSAVLVGKTNVDRFANCSDCNRHGSDSFQV